MIKYRYSCKKCGYNATYIKEKHIKCGCGKLLKCEFQDYLFLECKHCTRGEKIDRNKCGLNCGYSEMKIYWCEYFREKVVKLCGNYGVKQMMENIDDFNGRLCKNCKVPKVISKDYDPNFKTFKVNHTIWQLEPNK